MKKTAQRNLSLITRCILAILIPCSALTLAQSGVTTPDRGVKLGNAYIVSEFDTINTTNGNLMLNFPLAQLPAGRGAATAGVSLSYSSKLYNMRSDKRPDYRRDPSYYDRTVIEPDVNGGWSLNVGAYKLEYETRFGQYEPNCTAAVGSELNQQIQYSIKLKVVFPDGSSHEMIPLLHKDVLGDRYFNVRMDGEIRTCQGTRHVARPVYYSRDGSFLRLVTQGPDRWTLYFADGSKVVDGNRFYDKNGNYVAGTTDEFGRSVTAGTVDMNGYQDVISKGFNGEEVVWRIKWKTIYVSKTYAACPPHHVCPDDQTFYNYPRDLLWASFDVVEKIIQPSQLGGGAYTFSYNGVDTPPSIPGPTTHGWGELSAIELPSGAKLKYEYGLDGQDGPEHVDQTRYILLNHVTSKTLTYDLEYDGQIVDDGAVERWDYDLFYDRSSVTAPDGSVTQTFFPTTEPDLNGNVPWDSGLTTKTISPDGTMVENIWERNSPTGCHGESTCPNGYLREHPDNPYVKATFTSIKEGTSYARTAIKAFTYDMNGNVIETREYDYMPFGIVPRENGLATGRPTGLPPNADNYLKRVNRTEFYNQPPPAPTNPSTNFYDPNIYVYAAGSKLLNLERAKEVRAAASGPVQSRVESVYDFVDRAAQNTKGGNLILARQWDSTRLPVLPPGTALDDSNSIKTQATYNEYGMPTTSTDANGNVTRTSYGLIAGPNTSYTDLYPTQTVTAFGTSVARTSTFTYDFFSGLVTLTTDADNGISVRTSYDAVGRPTLNAKAIGTSAESRTVTEYNDYERKIITRSDIETAGDGRKVSSQFFDPIGRIRLSKTLEDASVQSAANETDGIKIQTRYRSTAGNTYRLTSNPYRAPYSSQANGEETMGWTRSKTSSTGLREESETFSGAALPAPWGTSNTTTGVVVTVKDANSTTTTDQSGRKKRKLVDAFGQLIRVDEPDVSGNLGSVTAPVQPTTYSYNALGNMTRAQQGVQNRYFLYDSMGRLIRIRQPEQAVNPALGTIGNSENNSWTAAFSHDANGNVIGAVDPRNVSVSTAFDRLNRPITRSYSDATPTVTFVYDDSAVSYARGRLTKISSSVSELRYLGYDPDGRVTESEQVTDGRAYRSAYAYNLAGAITEQRYPSGRVVKNFREADGDISSVASRGPSGPFKNYAADLSYTSTGRIDRLQLGNGLWESARLNSRGQVVEMKLGNSSIEPAIWTVNYRYGELNQDGSVDILKNSGNVAKQLITIAGVASPFVQTYKYDALERLIEASEANDEIPTWNQQFGYDRYGNRIALSQQINGQPVPNDNLTLPQVDPATNRFQANQGYSYDAAGNLTGDPQGRGFIFNGDNKQVEIRNAQGLVIGRYAYDGNGRRIKKTTVAETVVFVYDAHGKLVAEMSTAALPVERTVSYTATDPLGSPRVLTNGRGQVTSRRDFLPFGEEAASDGSFRRTILKYGVGDSVRQKFTGYQRDPETDLDFAEARMYEKRHGRFTAVDPLLASGKSEDPQTFNRYVYALNRPLILTDPTGMQATTQPSTAEQEAIEDAEPEQVKVTVAVSPATEKRLSVQLAMILNAAYHKEIEIVKSGNIDRQAETKKSAIKSVTESFAPSISIGGSTTGPSVNITFTPASPAKPVEAYATSSIDTTRRVEQHRIQTETAVNTVIANANTEYQDRNVSRAERNRSLEASARRALKLHQRSVH